MTNVDIPEPAAYQPTPAQLERAAALRRFNRRFVYGPVVIAGLIVAVVVGLMIIYGVIRDDARPFLSAVADVILILILFPAVILSLVIPAGFTYLFVQARQKGSAPQQQLRILLWRLDSLINRLALRWREFAPRLARPVIQLNVQFVRVERFMRRVTGGT